MNVNNQFQGIPNNPIMNNFNNNFSQSSMQSGNNINNNNPSNNSMSFNMLNMNSMMNNMNSNNMMNNMMMNNMNNMNSMNALNMNSMMNNNTNNNMMNNMMMNGKMNFNNMRNNINNPMPMNNNNNNNNNINLAMFNSRTDFRPSNSKFNTVNISNNKNQNIFNQNQSNDGQKNAVNISNACGLCLEKKKKLKMCKYCNCVVCENCLNEWLKKHNSCYKCKTKIKIQDMITIPFDDSNMKNENNIINNTNSQQQNDFINKASASKPLNKGNNNNNQQFISSNLPNNNMNINNNMNNNINNSMNNNINNNMNSINMNNNINNINMNNNNNIIQNEKTCPIHNNLMVYHCVNCNKEFCSSCLLFFGQEAQKHKGHLILEISQMNNQNIKLLLDEYNKLPFTKNSLDHLIGLSNFKIRENEIKKFEVNHFMNAIQEAYLKKIDEDSVELKSILEDLKKQKDIIDNSISSIPNGFNNIVNSNDYVQGGVLSQELKKINKFDPALKYKIQDKSKNNPLLFIDNYESDFLEFQLPFNGNYAEGKEIVNKNLNFIPGFPCRIIMKFLQKKVYISLLIDINVPLNQMEKPKFFTYISFKNKKYGLEFSNLSEQNYPPNMMNINRQQVNTVDMEAEQFLYLVDNGKIKLKIYATVIHYKYE